MFDTVFAAGFIAFIGFCFSKLVASVAAAGNFGGAWIVAFASIAAVLIVGVKLSKELD